MVRLLKPKNINRAIVALALLAPIVYLFGSLFSTLFGAHEGFPFNADYEVQTASVHADFRQMLPNRLYTSKADSYGLNYTYKGHYYVINGTFTGDTSNEIDFLSAIPSVSLIEGHKYYMRAPSLPFSSGYDLIAGPTAITGYRFGNGSVSFTAVSTGLSYCLGRIWNIPNGVVFDNFEYWFNMFDFTDIFGFGNEPTVAQFESWFPARYYEFSENSVSYDLPVYGVPDNSQFLFNQFFPKDNFIEQIGRNALSANPMGFAPFGHLLGFIDSNMLHIGGTPIGLLGYGYLYWCAHVLILDLICYFMTFFIRLIKSIVDKWEVSQW